MIFCFFLENVRRKENEKKHFYKNTVYMNTYFEVQGRLE